MLRSLLVTWRSCWTIDDYFENESSERALGERRGEQRHNRGSAGESGGLIASIVAGATKHVARFGFNPPMYLFWNAAARSDCSFGELVPLIAGEAVLCALARPVMRPPSEGLMAMVGLDPSTFFEAGLAPFGLFASVLAVAPCIHAFAPGGCVPPAAVILFAPIALIRALAWFSEWSFDMRLRWNPCEQMRSHWQGGMWCRGYVEESL